ncbi:hypothetical protein [Tateyamaria sp. syn59]|uniref:hypothetical protein n=1 Tax=Tateyamaria sp. syn59 TaxID=2576942 RepID=UPI0011BF1F57|nr:hypothetical protein [Tateyamaria sp. syn59]
MKILLLSSAALMALSACAQVVSEERGTFNFDNRTFPATTRVLQTGDNTFSRRTIVVGATRVTCSATDDRDCVQAIRERRNRTDSGV